MAIQNVMEAAATAETSRPQLWQWIRHGASIDDGGAMTHEYYLQVRAEELARLDGTANAGSRSTNADALQDKLVLGDFAEFHTVVGYRVLE